ncbi:MAG: DUF5719 family protein, partial [Nocardioides sp.]
TQEPTQAGVVRLASTTLEGPGSAALVVLPGAEAAPREIPLEGARPAQVDVGSAVVVRATGDSAPGLVAVQGPAQAATPSRPREEPQSVESAAGFVGCQEPTAEHWFTGVGAAARHASTLVVVNPDPGTAVVDVEVLSSSGVIDVPSLRGVAVPAHSVARLDLAALVPRRGQLALHATVSRGRLGVFVEDRVDDLGRLPVRTAWLAGQSAPATASIVTGAGGGPGSNTLVVANGGDSEARVGVQLMTSDSSFAPAGLAEVRVPPRTVTEVALGALAEPTRVGVVGVRVESSEPITATLRSVSPRQLSVLTAAEPIGAPGADTGGSSAAVLVPAGLTGADKPKDDKPGDPKPGDPKPVVVLASVSGTNEVLVRQFSASGAVLGEAPLSVPAEHAVILAVDPDTAWLQVEVTESATSAVVGALQWREAQGFAALPLQSLATSALVPEVGPANDAVPGN